MQIQRWQSLFLLLAAALMGALNFMPIATFADGAQMSLTSAPVLLVLDILVAVLLFILIFMYKNLRKQMQVTVLTIVLMVAFGAIAFEVLHTEGATVAWCSAFPAYIASLIFAIVARRLMRRDYNLLRSADRLR